MKQGAGTRSEPARRVVASSEVRRPEIPDYELLRLVGRGSYGDVWLARGLTGAYRAVKVLWRDRFDDPEPFEREFKGLVGFTTVSLEDAGQLALLHVGRDERAGFLYYVMELADDVSTGRVVDPHRYAPLTAKEMKKRRGRLPAAEGLAFGIELARALTGLHARGLLHRDIKPSNIILVNGVAKLADIGLVASSSTARTFVGTQGYVPPEGSGTVSADVFALGKVLYELATGLGPDEFPRLPPESNEPREHRALLELNEIILRACDPAPARRYRDAAALLADLEALQRGRSLRLKRLRHLVLRSAAVLAMLASVVIAVWWTRAPAPKIPPQTHVAKPSRSAALKSIVVLPFENLSGDAKGAATATAVGEEISTALTMIADFSVTARRSARSYAHTTKRVAEIARELDVDYIVEGSVQHADQRVRINAQLVEAATERQLWAQPYERPVTDIFIQADVANQIASALHATLSPQERRLIARRPTESLDAYKQFAQAVELLDSDATANVGSATTLLQNAVELDPKFSRAWAQLAWAHSFSYFTGRDKTPAQWAKAKAAVDMTVRLAPESAEAAMSLGEFEYRCTLNFARAAAHYERALELAPTPHPMTVASLGFLYRREGRWAEMLSMLERSVQLDPRSGSLLRELAGVYAGLHRWDDAIAAQRRVTGVSPYELRPAHQLAWVHFLKTGSTAAADRWLATLKPTAANAQEIIYLRKQWARYRQDYAEFRRLDREHPYVSVRGAERWQQDVLSAKTLYYSGDVPTARTRAAKALRDLRVRLEGEPENETLLTHAVDLHLILGDHGKALECGKQLVRLHPESKDRLFGVMASGVYASILASVGEKERALAELARLSRVPFGLLQRNGWGSVHSVPHQVGWWPLRDDPRFKALLADPANHAPLRL